MNVLLFFTFNVSLIDWKKSGVLDREIKYYQKLTSDHNCKFTFFTYGDDKDLQLSKNLNLDINIITLFKKKRFKNSLFVFFYSIIYLLRNYQKFSHFHIFKSNQNYGSWLAVFFKWINKKKLVSRCGYDLFHFSLLKKNPIKIIISYIICLFVYKNSDSIFSPNEYYKYFISKYFFIRKDIIKIIPNFVDTDIFFQNTKYKKFNKRLLFIGRLEKQKNIFSILKAIRSSDYQLDILGNGSLKLKIIKYSKKYNCKIKFIEDDYSNNQLPTLINKYSHLILFSLYEGNPKVLLEAMGCGLCVIASNTYGINNIIKNNFNGVMLDLNDYHNILKKINMLDKTKIENISKNASEFVRNQHSLNIISNLEYLSYPDV